MWRKFQFFEKEAVKEERASLIQSLVINCVVAGRGKIILGDSLGCLNIIDRDFVNIVSFSAYSRVLTHSYQLKNSNFLITVGDDEDVISPTVKIWNMEKPDKNGNLFTCIRNVRIARHPPKPATCISATEDLNHIAVGLCDGTVILISGDFLHEKSSKQLTLETGENPITGVGFHVQPNQVALFVVTSGSVMVYKPIGKEISSFVLDSERGCGVGCAVMNDEGELLVGQSEAIYFYYANEIGRGPCLAFDGEKKLLYYFRNYLVVISQDTGNFKYHTLNIYDIKNKLVAYSDSRFPNITHVVNEWGLIHLFTSDNKIYTLVEKDTQSKLETLFKKNLYTIAIGLAFSQNCDFDSIVDIYRRYGDHQYDKGDYDSAMTQYIQTIGKLEPSYVIRRFLDAQRIHNLTSYLQALHEKGLANADHTTLLFNCYTKLKDVEKLDKFIKVDSEVTFEVETAIKACRQAGYFEHAIYLAKKYKEHDWYLKILLEDTKEFLQALNYISTLEFSEAEKNLKKYGKVLITNLPEQTTALLMRLCSNYNGSGTGASETSRKTTKASAEEFIHIFVGQSEQLTKFLEFILQREKGIESILCCNTLLELYLRDEELSMPSKGIESNAKEQVSTNEKRTEMRKKALDLLYNNQYDVNHALVLCKMHQFRDGLLYLYKKLSLFEEIIQYHMDHNEYGEIIFACKEHGGSDSNLWILALKYFVSKQETCQKEIKEVLEYIDRDNLLPPLMVIQLLSENQSAPLSLIKDHISKRLALETQMIEEDQRQIKRFEDEIRKMQTEIKDIKTSARLFQMSKCSYCTSPLDLPAVHFLCMHSFHQRCLSENEQECPLCAPENKKILEIRRSLEESIGQHDQFYKKLDNSPDGFSVVSEYFGRSIFSKVILVNDRVTDTQSRSLGYSGDRVSISRTGNVYGSDGTGNSNGGGGGGAIITRGGNQPSIQEREQLFGK